MALAEAEAPESRNDRETGAAFLQWLGEWVAKRFPGETLADPRGLEGDQRARWMSVTAEMRAWREELKREGIQEGIQEGLKTGLEKGVEKGLRQGHEEGFQNLLTDKRRLLASQARVRFGPAVAERLSGLLDRMSDSGRLDAIAILVVDCESGDALLARVNGT